MAERTYSGRPLSKQENIFVNAYMENYALEQKARIKAAAAAAGCSKAYFNHDAVQREINERESKLTNANIATAKEVLEFYTSVMRGKELDAFGLDVSIDSRLKAADSLAKRIVDTKETDKDFTIRLVRD